MNKSKNISITKIIFYTIFLTSLLSMLLLATFNIANDYYNLKKIAEYNTKQLLNNEREDLKSSIYRFYNTMSSDYENRLKDFTSNVKEQALNALVVVNMMYSKNDESFSLEVIKNSLKDIHLDGKFSIYDYDGNPLLEPFAFTRSYIRSLASDSTEGRAKTHYLSDNKTKVLSYAVNFEPLKIIIVYSADIQILNSKFMENVKNIIKNFKTNTKEHLYLIDKSKWEVLASNASSFDADDSASYAQSISSNRAEILNIANSSAKEGFFECRWEKDDREKCNIISFIKNIDELNWIISSGFFDDNITKDIQEQQKALFSNFLNKIFIHFLYFLFIIAIIFIINSFIKIKFDAAFSKFIGHFSDAHNNNNPISTDKLEFDEFKILAQGMNQILALKIQEERKKEDNIVFLNQYKNAVDISSIVTKTNNKGIIKFVNDAFCNISGFSRDEIIGKTHAIVRHPDANTQTYKDAWDTLKTNKPWHGVFKNLNKFKETYYLQVTILPILDADGNIDEYLGIGFDITELINQSKKIQANLQDPLTKLPSRSALVDDINKNLNTSIVATFDILNFKHINEYYGFDMGDRLLVEISYIIEKLIANKNLSLYKLASDNFAILADKKYWTPSELANFCLEIRERFKQKPIFIRGDKFEVNLTFGISDEICYFIKSEMAKDYAKANGNSVVIFSDKKDFLLRNVNIIQDLKKAIEEDRIIVYKQGIVSSKTKQTVKYECLMRMIDENNKIVSPFFFLEAAKKSRLYPKLTQIMIDKSFKYFSKNSETFSLNLAIEDILSNETIDYLKKKLFEYDGIAKRLIIEIVEDEGIENFDEVMAFIDEMREIGCQIAIDDFGTGYSNFGYLVNLKADSLKIDGSLIKNIDKDKTALEVVRLIVEFARKLNMEIVTEFVATKEISDMVDRLNVDHLQGFFYDIPKPLEG